MWIFHPWILSFLIERKTSKCWMKCIGNNNKKTSKKLDKTIKIYFLWFPFKLSKSYKKIRFENVQTVEYTVGRYMNCGCPFVQFDLFDLSTLCYEFWSKIDFIYVTRFGYIILVKNYALDAAAFNSILQCLESLII